jgi:putative ABC transport system permease protein
MSTDLIPRVQDETRTHVARVSAGLEFGEVWRMAYQTFVSHKIRFGLTALGMMIGTASLILVVTIALTGKQFVLHQIQSIGSNMIEAYYEGGASPGVARQDFLTIDDIRAVRQMVPAVTFASPMFEVHTTIIAGNKPRDVVVLGVSPDYQRIRKLEILGGRFFDEDDNQSRNKTALLAEKLAEKLYGGQDAAIGRELRLVSLPFTIVGTFREGVETFGQTEISDDTIVIPDNVARYFSSNGLIKNAFFSVAQADEVPNATEQIRSVLQSRHRPGSVYHVMNLTELLSVAAKAANALTAVLLLVSTVTLVVSGVGIMNIMLATVNARIREIGVRKAVGATRREIQRQFLLEAALIAVVGGLLGIVVGLLIPLSLRWGLGLRIPISTWSVIIAIGVSSVIGVVFGTAPATRAANLDPVECLHYE